MSTRRYFAMFAIVIGAAVWFFALWKWALFGLDADVGMASFLTGLALIGVGGGYYIE